MFESDTMFCYQFGKWYYGAPVDILPRQNQIEDRDQVIALDPGVRKFLTGYSPEGKVEILGTNTQKVIRKYLCNISKSKQCVQNYRKNIKLEKRRTQRYQQRRKLRRLRQKYWRKEARLKNFVKNIHYKIAHHLCRNYEQIILPTFSSLQCSKKSGRTIGKDTVRIMGALAFYKFSERLKQTCSKYAKTNIVRGSEAYTSKQCGACGYLNDKLKGKEVFQCLKCDQCGDRDVHAARNIVLRFLK